MIDLVESEIMQGSTDNTQNNKNATKHKLFIHHLSTQVLP